MPTEYLFRIDGAKDNDEYFATLRSSVAHAYAGMDFRVGQAGWIPDLVRVVVEDTPDQCALTLIELEATESVALISCRKYLPENSGAILAAFTDYLDRVARQCRSSADPRESVFAGLKSTLSEASKVTVATAGALRSATGYVEEIPLIDQPKFMATVPLVNEDEPQVPRFFCGILRLSANDLMVLARCIIILDAVICHRDQSDANFKNWRQKAPFKRSLVQSETSFPALYAFVFKTPNRGLTVDFEKVLAEIVEIWSTSRRTQVDLEKIRYLVSSYFPIASQISSHDEMVVIFEAARKHVEEALE